MMLIRALLLAGALAFPGTARVPERAPIGMLPEDCLSLMAPGARSGLQDWRGLVAVEHCDRIKRLRRISAALPPEERPIFYESRVFANRLPANIGIDIPVLRVVFPERTFFDTDRSDLKPQALQVAEIISESLRHEPPDVVMFVAGHADARGSRAYNAALSVDRANALASVVLDKGVNVASVWRVGFGKDLPLIAGDDDWAYARNRRIEFLFAARSEAVAIWLADQQVDVLCQGQTAAETATCRSGLNFEQSYEVVQLPKEPLARLQIIGRPAREKLRTIDGGTTRGSSVTPPAVGGVHLDLAPPPTFTLDLRKRRADRLY